MRVEIEKAVAGDRAAVRSLVAELRPILQARAARALLRRRHAARDRDARQELHDLVQQVFLVLFADSGRVLKQWDEQRGLSFANFVGLVTEREIASILRRRRRDPWGEDPTEVEDLARIGGTDRGHETQVISRDLLRRLVSSVKARLSDRGLELFHWIILEDRSVEEVCALAGMTPDAVYAWRSRLARLLRELAAEILSDQEASQRSPPGRSAHEG